MGVERKDAYCLVNHFKTNRPRGYKTFFMLNSIIVGILTFMSGKIAF